MPRSSGLLRSLFLNAALVCLTAASAAGQAREATRRTGDSPPPHGAWLNLARSLPALMDSGGVPGMSVAVVEGGRLRHARGFGVRGAADPRPVDENTVFEAASLSKTVLAYATLRLADRGVIDLDRPLWDYLPVPDLDADPRARRMTARMVLSHTTGLQNELIGDDRPALAFEPGERFRYSGEGFLYLGRVLERVTGTPFGALMEREVFRPLGMRRSAYAWSDGLDANAALGHGGYGEPRAPTRPRTARASTLQTTASDYGRFLAAVLRGEGLRPETARLMFTPRVHVADGVEWGLGWALEGDGAARRVWHHGDNSNSGFTAFVMADPATRSGVVYFAGSTTGLGIVAAVLDRLRLFGDAEHASVRWIGYERYDAPSRAVRLAVERQVREAGAEAGLRAYQELQGRYPRGAFGEPLLNSLGYRFLAMGRVADAIRLFERNVEEYPASANVYDSLGEAYAAAGDRERAIRNYRRAVELDPGNAHAVQMIRRLQQNQPPR